MNKFDEEYYRVDFEVSKLLKAAGFDLPPPRLPKRSTKAQIS